MKTLVKKREDYKPLFWVPKKTFLDIYVQEDFTTVKSEVLFNKNEFSIIKRYNLESVIELNGVNLETLKFELLVDNDVISKDDFIDNVQDGIGNIFFNKDSSKLEIFSSEFDSTLICSVLFETRSSILFLLKSDWVSVSLGVGSSL